MGHNDRKKFGEHVHRFFMICSRLILDLISFYHNLSLCYPNLNIQNESFILVFLVRLLKLYEKCCFKAQINLHFISY